MTEDYIEEWSRADPFAKSTKADKGRKARATATRTDPSGQAKVCEHCDEAFVNDMEIVEADWAQQLANIRRMEANGELAAIPELPTK